MGPEERIVFSLVMQYFNHISQMYNYLNGGNYFAVVMDTGRISYELLACEEFKIRCLQSPEDRKLM